MAVDPGGGGRAWPGLSARSGEMRMDPDALNAAADELQAELDTLVNDSLGSLTQLTGAAKQPDQASWFGNWGTGREMSSGYDVAQDAIKTYYQKLAQELANAITVLRQSAGGTEAADRTSAAAYQAQEAGLGNTGPVDVQEV